MAERAVHRWIFLACGIVMVPLWFIALPLKPPFAWEDILMEALFLVGVGIAFILIARLKNRTIEVGIGTFALGLLIDLLDEFTSEPDLLSTDLEGILQLAGISLVVLGLYTSTRSLEANLAVSREKEEALRRSEERYRSLIEDINDVVCETDEHDRLVYVSPRIRDLLGYPQESLVGRTLFDFVAAEDRKEVSSFFDGAAFGRKAFTLIEHAMRHADGHTVIVQTSGTPMFGGGGAFQGYRLVLRDTTARRQAEEEVKRRNRQLLAINQIIGAAASSLSLNELMQTSLTKTLELLGFDGGMIYLVDRDRTRAELAVYQGFPRWIVPDGKILDIHAGPYRQVFVDGEPLYIDNYRERYPDREEFGIRAFASIPLVAHSMVVGAINIASRKNCAFTDDERSTLESVGREIGSAVLKEMLQQQLDSAYTKEHLYLEQLAAANREANLYLDIMVHDINNANMVSLGYADLIRERAGPELADYAKKLEKSVEKSIEIIRSVSTIRRIHRGEATLGPVDIDSVIRAEIRHHEGASIFYQGSPLLVYADDLLPEVFTNLIGNALKFGGPSVQVRIRVEDRGEEVDVAIEDTGPGIPDDLKPRVFDRFQRGSTSVPGTGLGLSITRMLMDRYGGRAWVEDRVPGTPGEGTVVRFRLKKIREPSTHR
ncbi:MAG: PAS domain S-box protein [Methanomicrobiales archaeon]|nr:PAS domain S-box protein [Methanomicrobiales archaeon]